MGRHGFDALIEEGHTLLDEAFGAGQTDAALVGEQFAHGADAAAAEMVNVVQSAFAFLEAEQVFGRGDQVGLGQNARVAAFDAELLIDLVAAHAAEVVAFGIKEQALDEGARIGGGRRVARTQAAVNVLERFFLVLGGVLLHALDDDPVVEGRIHDFDLVDAQFGDLVDHGGGQRFEGARHNQALLLIHGILDEDLVGQIFTLLGFFDGELFNFVKELENLFVGATGLFLAVLVLALAFALEKRQRPEEGGGQEFPAALLAIQINIK